MSDVPQPADMTQRPKDNTRTLLFGCLGVALVAVIATVIFAWWLYSNAKSWGTDLARNAVVEQIEGSRIPDDQKTELVKEVDRLSQGFKDGRISMEKLGGVMENLTEGPLFFVLGVYFAQAEYIGPSDLSAEEKEAAERTLQRFSRGIFEKLISEKETEKALDPLKEFDEDGQWQLKDNPTSEELRDFLAAAQRLADDAGVPDEAFEVNVAEEFRKAIDDALGEEE